VVTKPVKSRRGRGYTAALIGLSFLLLACLGSPSADPAVRSSAQDQAQTFPAVQPPIPTTMRASPPAALDVFPADRAVNVPPDAPVVVTASSGTLRAVKLVDAKGGRVAGKAGSAGTWATSELLRPATAYTLTIAAVGPEGRATFTTSSFRTLTPKVSATYSLIPAGGTVGVGMPVIVQFDTAVTTKARRAEVEKRVKVTTVPVQRGAWGWLDDRQLMWRPRSFWAPGTKVTVSTPLHGVQTGDDKWITGDAGTTFTVGLSMVSSVDMKAHTLTVRRNGNTIRTIPVSTGKPGPLTETRSGTKVIIERSNTIVMDSATVGIPKGSPGYYKIKTRWNLRLTWTGEFIHSAPWSVNAQGSQNVSHGCTNMAPANAEWMFSNSKMGDVVIFTGSNRAFQPGEGIGVWVYDFHGWQARSALA
jgi:lipoprotein-anchoring transpeptidase ErfK/SrfK